MGKQVGIVAFVLLVGFSAVAETNSRNWRLAENRVDDGASMAVFVEAEKRPGRPTFKIEPTFNASPLAAARTLMRDMMNESDLPDGLERKILDRGERSALIYTLIDLPLMLADRELAIRVVHTDDPDTGIHRIDWSDANDALPAQGEDGGVVRLSGTQGYWEFRPAGASGSEATYLTQTEIGGSIPNAIGDRLMKGQAVDAVTRLRGHIEARTGVVDTRDEEGLPSGSSSR